MNIEYLTFKVQIENEDEIINALDGIKQRIEEVIEAGKRMHDALDVAPVVHGRWVMSTDRTYMPQCTNCGAHPFKGYIPSLEEVQRVYKFCPCCNAKMESEVS